MIADGMFKLGETNVAGGVLTSLAAVLLQLTHSWDAPAYLKAACEAGIVATALGLFMCLSVLIWRSYDGG